MCKVLKNIQGKTAEEILRKYGQDNIAPINLNQLLLNMGISACPYDFSEVEQNTGIEKDSISGAVITDGDAAIILYREKDSLNRQRFTIAHELAHYCLHVEQSDSEHIEFRTNEKEKDKREIEADIFAGKLLIPVKLLHEIYIRLDVPNSVTLANKFGVSTNVMEARLDYLKVSYYNKNGKAVVYGDE